MGMDSRRTATRPQSAGTVAQDVIGQVRADVRQVRQPRSRIRGLHRLIAQGDPGGREVEIGELGKAFS